MKKMIIPILFLVGLIAMTGIVSAFGQVDSAHTTDTISVTVQHKSAPSKPVDSSTVSDSLTTSKTGTNLVSPTEQAKTSDTTTTTKLSAIDWQLLANHPSQRFVYIPALNAVNPAIPSNYYMDIVMPDGTTWTGLILSYADFQTLKTNVAIMWVGNIHTTTAVTNSPYCAVAQFTWDHEDGYAYKVAGMKNLVVPVSCQNGSSVPEFGQITAIILSIAVLTAIVFGARAGLRFVPKY